MSVPAAEIRDPRTYAIIGAGMEVHRELKRGFLEAVYKDALKLEFANRMIPALSEVQLPVYYKGQLLPSFYRADFVCFESVIVEVKSVKQLTAIDRAQAINYLRVTGFQVAVLFNFGAFSLEYERIVHEYTRTDLR